MELFLYIKQKTQLPQNSIESTVALLAQDCTIPFIARYRKEKSGGLDEVAIGAIVQYKEQFEVFDKRKKTILKAVDEQGALTPELRRSFESARDLSALEDLYVPFKRSKKTKAAIARAHGLEPLATLIMAQQSQNISIKAKDYISEAIVDKAAALEGARHIIAEWINERTEIRTLVRNQLRRTAMITTKVIAAQKKEEKAQKYNDYFDWNEPLKQCPSHRLLAILRAESEKFIRIKITLNHEELIAQLERRLVTNSKSDSAEHLKIALEDAYKRLLFPSLSNEQLKKAKIKADEAAILVFTKNLRQLLLGAPLGERRILAIDPGFRTGCKVVCLNEQGGLVHYENIYPHAPQNKITEAMNTLAAMVQDHKIEAIAIGNGTASRETEQVVKNIVFKHPVEIFIVSEAGASIYSASKIAREEFPDHDITVRGAVSIGRRLTDPLSELVKIDPKSIGVGQYQHDVDQQKLKTSLDTVVESCVNTIGVNINTASVSLLSYVSGIGVKLAENIVAHRTKNGSFENRNAIKNVARLGDKAFEQGAAFLRIKNAKNPLDNSTVHPESYGIVEKMAKDQATSILDLIGNKPLLDKINLDQYCTNTIGLPTLKDIISELVKPGVDTRKKAKAFAFDSTIKSIENLHEGQVLPGIVNNITNFGCFVDIGIKESGLIHVSNLSDNFVKDVAAHVQLQQQVTVTVLSVDLARKRIQLALLS